MEQEFMKERAIVPLVMSMSIPSILSMLINSMYNIVDSYFVASISEEAMTAISIVFPVQNLSLAVAVGFGVGTGALISISLGKGDRTTAHRAASVGMVLCVFHGIIINIGCTAGLTPFLSMYSQDQDVLSMAHQYAVIVMAFAVVQHIFIGIEKIYQGVGRMKLSMFAMMFGCIINIILDPLLIFGMGPFPGLGIAGAAWATAAGQFLELLLYIWLSVRFPLPVRIGRAYVRPDASLIRRLYGVGIPASLNMLLPSILISVLNSILAAYSQTYIVVLGIYYKLQTFVYMPANGLIQGIRPIAGYNFGAGEFGRVRKIYRVSLMICGGIMAAGTAACLLLPEELMGLFSDHAGTIEEGARALRIISMGFIVSSISITACGTLEGLGSGTRSLVISSMRYMVVIIPLALVLDSIMGAEGVWHAFWITEAVTGAAAFILYRRTFRRMATGTTDR